VFTLSKLLFWKYRAEKSALAKRVSRFKRRLGLAEGIPAAQPK
jgi:hypothetical protein